MSKNEKNKDLKGGATLRSGQKRIGGSFTYSTGYATRIIHSGSNSTGGHENKFLSFGHRYPLTYHEAFGYSGGDLPAKIEMGGDTSITDQARQGPIQVESTNFKIIDDEEIAEFNRNLGYVFRDVDGLSFAGAYLRSSGTGFIDHP